MRYKKYVLKKDIYQTIEDIDDKLNVCLGWNYFEKDSKNNLKYMDKINKFLDKHKEETRVIKVVLVLWRISTVGLAGFGAYELFDVLLSLII